MFAIELVRAVPEEFEVLLSLRIEAMRQSLEHIGRFDPARARERFAQSFAAEQTRHIELKGERIGFVAVRPEISSLLLDHLYIHPRWQGCGVGEAILKRVFSEADLQQLPLKVGALKGSSSNRFYQRYGFVLVNEEEFDNYYIRSSQRAA